MVEWHCSDVWNRIGRSVHQHPSSGGGMHAHSNLWKLTHANLPVELDKHQHVEVDTFQSVEVYTLKTVKVDIHQPVEVDTYQYMVVDTLKTVRVDIHQPEELCIQQPVEVDIQPHVNTHQPVEVDTSTCESSQINLWNMTDYMELAYTEILLQRMVRTGWIFKTEVSISRERMGLSQKGFKF